MAGPLQPAAVIEGRCVHKASNALKIEFRDGPGDAIATGIQGAGDGKAKKLGVLFGFKNGGTGNHRLTLEGGRVLNVASGEGKPSLFTDEKGDLFATAVRGATSTVTLSDHTDVFTLADDPEDARTPERFRLLLNDQSSTSVGRLEVIRRAEGWSLLSDVYQETIWFGHAGQPLPVPILGTRVTLWRQPTDVEREALLCMCVDIAIGLRPYTTSMQ
jgi:hypothetical protein